METKFKIGKNKENKKITIHRNEIEESNVPVETLLVKIANNTEIKSAILKNK